MRAVGILPLCPFLKNIMKQIKLLQPDHFRKEGHCYFVTDRYAKLLLLRKKAEEVKEEKAKTQAKEEKATRITKEEKAVRQTKK